MFDTGDLISIAVALITIGTIFYARRALIASDSPRLVVKRYIQKKYYGTSDVSTFEFITEVKNYGKGVAPKTFLLLILEGEKKKYYLSKPLTLLEPDNTGTITLKMRTGEDMSKFQAEYLKEFGIKGAYLVTQDFFGGLYYAKINKGKNNNHLIGFNKPVTKVFRYSSRSLMIRYWMRKSAQQKNTYPDREGREWERKWKQDIVKLNIKDVED